MAALKARKSIISDLESPFIPSIMLTGSSYSARSTESGWLSIAIGSVRNSASHVRFGRSGRNLQPIVKNGKIGSLWT